MASTKVIYPGTDVKIGLKSKDSITFIYSNLGTFYQSLDVALYTDPNKVFYFSTAVKDGYGLITITGETATLLLDKTQTLQLVAGDLIFECKAVLASTGNLQKVDLSIPKIEVKNKIILSDANN